MYREFVLRNAAVWQSLVAVVKANAKAFADRGEPLRLILTSEQAKRTSEQNRYFHGPVLDAITQQAWWEGRQYPKEFWKEYFRRRFLLKDEYQTPTGEIVQTYYSTADLSTSQFTEFLEKVKEESASDWGVQFE